jgi:hypothetical protein
MPKKLPAPGRNRGRIQVAVRHLFLLSDCVLTSHVMDAAFPRKPKRVPRDYKSAHRALAQVAVERAAVGGAA